MDTPGAQDLPSDEEMDAAAHELDVAFGEAIRRLRMSKDWRQEDLAARARLSVKTIGRIENGSTMQTPQMLRISTAFGIGLGDLVKQALDLDTPPAKPSRSRARASNKSRSTRKPPRAAD
ncbi:helix-turn-helix domain-containing protein [Nocardia brasiliensis]|uniref:helix-turn-helix domain-containing protein n=1 Tax=Nocardia brasiliensis TaxID=37326 RepID=UPI00366B7C0C